MIEHIIIATVGLMFLMQVYEGYLVIKFAVRMAKELDEIKAQRQRIENWYRRKVEEDEALWSDAIEMGLDEIIEDFEDEPVENPVEK